MAIILPTFSCRFDKVRVGKVGVGAALVRCRRCPCNVPTKGRFSPDMTV